MARTDWIEETTTVEGVRFVVNQRKWEPLKRTIWLGAALLLLTALTAYAWDHTKGADAFMVFIFGGFFILGGGLVFVIMLPMSLVESLTTNPRSVFIIDKEHISFEEKPSSKTPQKIPLCEVSGIYRKSGDENASSSTVNIHVSNPAGFSGAAHNIGNGVGKAAEAWTAFYEKHYWVGVNHKGKEIELAQSLSDTESDYLYGKVKSILC